MTACLKARRLHREAGERSIAQTMDQVERERERGEMLMGFLKIFQFLLPISNEPGFYFLSMVYPHKIILFFSYLKWIGLYCN